ncbi:MULTISPECIES: FHA domain-containing protein [unclassified Bradyrhizobium]|uniref:SctD/MshK family protein n=1 Tax=unclassified Bradyrhizobium TaxID=2631580 RepID=UPI0029168481|nr:MULTISPECIES: EscD/YscD/HrpQ family type III secretion system periplasmic domain-containing protein [unclassified Bradyrhizobium]
MPASPSPFELTIRSGLHAGVRQELDSGTYLVGHSMDADVVLMDDCLAPLHARFALEADCCEIEGTADNVLLNGTLLGAGEARFSRYPADVVLNGIQLRCTRKRRTTRYTFLRYGLGTAAILVCLALLLQGFPAGADKVPGDGGYATAERLRSPRCDSDCSTKYPSRHAPNSPAPTLTPARLPGQDRTGRAGAEPGAPVADLNSAADALRQRLLTAGLTTVEIVSDSNAITARGNIEPAALGRWRDIERWFDGTFGIAIVLTSQVEAKSVKRSAPLTVQAIWAGNGPYVIDGRGQKLFAGAVISEGWIVDRIEQDRVVLRRGADLLAVSL